jgi:hypothetical protein
MGPWLLPRGLGQTSLVQGENAMEWVTTLVSFPVIPVLGLATLFGACAIVARCRRKALIAAYLLFIPFPLIVAFFDLTTGMKSSFAAIASGVPVPQQAEVYAALAGSLRVLILGLVPTALAYLVVAVGLFARTLQAGREMAAAK